VIINAAQERLDQMRERFHARCVACGSSNGHVPQLRFQAADDGSVEAWFRGGTTFQSYDGILHGGVIATLLDAAMTNCLFAQSRCGVTGELTVRFRHPVVSGEPSQLKAWIERATPPLFVLRAELWQFDRCRATAIGKFMECCEADLLKTMTR
jgi:acyl-coenzyme A thioesterase PaaI-like protein